MNKSKIYLFFLVLVIIIAFCYQSIMQNWFIAHALGNYKGIAYTNSFEAFESSYKKGFRQFEVELMLTNDNKVILFHGYNKGVYKKLNIPVKTFSYEDFMSGKITKIISKDITPLNLNDFIELMNKYKNIQVMLHIHSNNDSNITDFVIKEILNATNYDSKILDRLLIGINYSRELEVLNRYPQIKNILFYVREKNKRNGELKDIEQIISYLKENNIRIVSMPYKAVMESPKEVKALRKNKIYIYSFTQNNVMEILKMKMIGVHTIGTDGLLFSTAYLKKKFIK